MINPHHQSQWAFISASNNTAMKMANIIPSSVRTPELPGAVATSFVTGGCLTQAGYCIHLRVDYFRVVLVRAMADFDLSHAAGELVEGEFD